MILVTGATGTAGRAIVAALKARDVAPRVLTRDPVRARALLGDGLEVMAGDLRDPAALGAALDGVERALLLSPNTSDQEQVETGFIVAARREGLRHVVGFSGLGAAFDSPSRIARCHAAVERALEDSGVPFTHLRPNTFMQNLLADGPAIASTGLLKTPLAETRVSVVDVRDVADVAAIVLTEPGHAGRTYVLTGPEAMSPSRIAAILTKVLLRTVSGFMVGPDEYRSSLVNGGMDAWLADALVELRTGISEREGCLVTSAVADVTGRPPITFERFARDHIAAFAAAGPLA